jgi:hypothetical protein
VKVDFLFLGRRSIPVVLGVVGACVIMSATSRYGAGVTPDSVTYISVARSIADGNGIADYFGNRAILKPPLYPIILAAVSLVFRIDPLLSARFVNALLFGLIIWLSALLFRKHLRSAFPFVELGTIYVLVSPAIIAVSLQVWADALFVVLVLLYLIFTDMYMEKRNAVSLVLLSLAVALASLTRYLGIALVLTGVIHILSSIRSDRLTRARHLLLFASISIPPIAVCMIRNYALTATLFAYNPLTLISPHLTLGGRLENIYLLARAILRSVRSWYIPGQIDGLRPALLILAIGLIAAWEYKKSWRKLSSLAVQIHPALLFTIVYTGVLLLTDSAVNVLEVRYISPIFVPTTLLLLVLVRGALKPLLERILPRRAGLLGVVLAVFMLIDPTEAAMRAMRRQMEKGSGYTGETWRSSETIRYVTEHREPMSECATYTNGPDAMYLLTGLKTKSCPTDGLPRQEESKDASALKGPWPAENGGFLVWFNNLAWRKYQFSVDELERTGDIIEVAHLSDGSVYRISERQTAIRDTSPPGSALRIQP